jgi:hypothetical protein
LPPVSFSWALPPETHQNKARELLKLLGPGPISGKRRLLLSARLLTWLQHADERAAAAWEQVAWLGHLPHVVSLLGPDELDRLIQRAVIGVREGGVDWQADPVRYQLLLVETPLLLASLFAGSAASRAWQSQASAAFKRLAAEWLDGEGLPHGRYVPAMSSVLASWARCLALQPRWLDAADREQFTWLVRQSLRLLRPKGSLALDSSDTPLAQLIRHCAGLAGDPETQLLSAALLEGKKPPAKTKVLGSVYSEWASVAVLRSRLERESPQIAVAFDDGVCRLELNAPSPLLGGTWSQELRIDGKLLPQPREWEEVCWHHDEAAVYLELEAAVNDPWRIQRHILLARNERFALLADAVLGESSAKIEYVSRWSFADGVSFAAEAETHEGFLTAKNKRWLALPLALPEWRIDRPRGSLKLSDGGLELRSAAQGTALFHPLFIPLLEVRPKLDYTWRQLTVAEQLAIQPPDAAAAYRVQLGDRQWGVYRALARRGNRTFLGKNTVSEFFVGAFNPGGDWDAIMEVE